VDDFVLKIVYHFIFVVGASVGVGSPWLGKGTVTLTWFANLLKLMHLHPTSIYFLEIQHYPYLTT
jgi:hypothetical protein